MEKVESSLSDRNATRGLVASTPAARGSSSALEGVSPSRPGGRQAAHRYCPRPSLQTGARRAAHAHLPAPSAEVVPVHLLQPGVDRVPPHPCSASMGEGAPLHTCSSQVWRGRPGTHVRPSARRGGSPCTSLSQAWAGLHAHTLPGLVRSSWTHSLPINAMTADYTIPSYCIEMIKNASLFICYSYG